VIVSPIRFSEKDVLSIVRCQLVQLYLSNELERQFNLFVGFY